MQEDDKVNYGFYVADEIPDVVNYMGEGGNHNCYLDPEQMSDFLLLESDEDRVTFLASVHWMTTNEWIGFVTNTCTHQKEDGGLCLGRPKDMALWPGDFQAGYSDRCHKHGGPLFSNRDITSTMKITRDQKSALQMTMIHNPRILRWQESHRENWKWHIAVKRGYVRWPSGVEKSLRGKDDANLDLFIGERTGIGLAMCNHREDAGKDAVEWY